MSDALLGYNITLFVYAFKCNKDALKIQIWVDIVMADNQWMAY